MDPVTEREARRLALVRAGLLRPEWTGLPRRARGRGRRAHTAAHSIIRRFGYLQLDTVAVSGARTHSIVLASRLEGWPAEVGEQLLRPGEPLFEYWGHEASWLPIELYPTLGFRREEFRRHPWWGDVVGRYPREAERLLARVRAEGPLRSKDLEGRRSSGWWNLDVGRKLLSTFWSAGVLAVVERRGFQRTYDLAERVIPPRWRERELSRPEAFKDLLERALAGHGWATTGTLAATWRLRNCRSEIDAALAALVEEGRVAACDLVGETGPRARGWIRPRDRELAARTVNLRPRRDRGVLLSPFDPLLWDRNRVRRLFGFEQAIEIYKPAAQRRYGYFCLPVLAGERLTGRVDLKADRGRGRLGVVSRHFEAERPDARARRAMESAIGRFGRAVELEPRSGEVGVANRGAVGDDS